MEITCTLDGKDLARQRERWQALGYRRELTADGLRLTFDRPDPAELRELVALENACCAWAHWSVEGDADVVLSTGCVTNDLVTNSTGYGIQTLHRMFTSPA